MKAENSERATNVFMQLLTIIPEEKQGDLISLMLNEERLKEPDKTREQLQGLLATLDLDNRRDDIVKLLLELIPVEHLVPPVYEKYRPMVVDAAHLILNKLSADRLRSKLIEQLMLP